MSQIDECPALMQDEKWMREAIDLAYKAKAQGEVPIGALIVREEKVIARGFNQSISTCDPSAHAEIVALRMAGAYDQNYRIIDTTLYVTLEPCMMCASAMVHARVNRLVFGAFDPKTGAVGSVLNALEGPAVNHRINSTGGVLEAQCAQILRQFFLEKRNQKNP